jgi:hypothetical protein
VRAGPISLYLTLLLALVTGVVPMSECRPTDGCPGGVVPLGAHGHGDHHDSHPGGGPDCDCVDSPMTLARPGLAVTLPSFATPSSAIAAVVALDVSPVAAVSRDAPAPVDAGIPLGTLGVVLLR